MISASDTSPLMHRPPQPKRRLPKRPSPLPPEVQSSASTEWVSVSAAASGRFSKKQRLEKTEFDSTPSSPKQVPARLPTPDLLEEEHAHTSAPRGVSRAVSVSIVMWSAHARMLTRSQTKIEEWIPFCQKFLDEILQHAAPPMESAHPPCTSCPGERSFSCDDCLGAGPSCGPCIVSSHQRLPLHTLQVNFFQFVPPRTLIFYPRSGTGHTLSQPPSPRSDWSFNLVTTLTTRVHTPVPSVTSWSWT